MNWINKKVRMMIVGTIIVGMATSAIFFSFAQQPQQPKYGDLSPEKRKQENKILLDLFRVCC